MSSLNAISFYNNLKLSREKEGYFSFLGIGEKQVLIMADLGAAVTIIPIDFENSEKDFGIDLQPIKNESNICYFTSASGHDVPAYYYEFLDVKLGDVLFPKFCCYLSPNEYLTCALLGRDFLNNASFAHTMCSSLLTITTYDRDKYVKDCREIFKALHNSSVAELSRSVKKNGATMTTQSEQASTITRKDEKHKDVAAAFRDMYEGKFGI